MAYSNIDAIRQALLQESLSNLGGQNVKGLLSPTQTPLQAGLLGAMTQLQPYTGYTTTPTTFGQSIGAALMGGASGVQRQKESDLTRALKGLELYGKLSPNLTEFQKNVKRFNELDSIPEDKRTQSEKNEYDFIKDRLEKTPPKENLLDIVKGAYAKNPEDRSQFEIDSIEKWKKEADLYQLLASNISSQGDNIPTNNANQQNETDYKIYNTMEPQQILESMNNVDDAEAEKIYDSLDSDIKEKVIELYNNYKS